jgi:hypothetical protein
LKNACYQTRSSSSSKPAPQSSFHGDCLFKALHLHEDAPLAEFLLVSQLAIQHQGGRVPAPASSAACLQRRVEQGRPGSTSAATFIWPRSRACPAPSASADRKLQLCLFQ